jgi:hypothetical protein
MRDPHPILQDEDLQDIDLTQRVPRKAGWDEYSLSDFPTDNIMPVSLSNNSDLRYLQPSNPRTVCKIYSRWIYEMCRSTADTGLEHAFRTDAYGNVYGLTEGIVENGGQSIYFNDHIIQHTLGSHTHPLGSVNENYNQPPPGFSQTDLDFLKERSSPIYECLVLCPNELIKTKVLVLGMFRTKEQKHRSMEQDQSPESVKDRYTDEVLFNMIYQAENIDSMSDPGSDEKQKGIIATLMDGAQNRFNDFVDNNTVNGESIVGLDVIKIRFEDGYAIPDEDIDITPEYNPYDEYGED